ncbi:hypothetical protein SISNIDRAFT_401448, partial [Sistotremastrum niveocremeum HHB9708]
VVLSEEARKTLERHTIWGKDPKTHLLSILKAALRPSFPYSEWDNIIRGKPINLDNVLSNLNAIVPDNRQTERIGTVEIRLNTFVTSKKVISHGDWVSAWSATERAYRFTMPWRRDELERYAQYIGRMFTAIPVSGHGCVIKFEQACRTRVSQQNIFTLQDFSEFVDLHTAFIVPAFSATTSSQAGRSSSSKSRDPCRRWNNNRCPDGSDCKYAHICKACRSGQHRSGD